MRELKALGVALVYISHKMDEIKVIADEVTIMRDGQYIGKWEVAEHDQGADHRQDGRP